MAQSIKAHLISILIKVLVTMLLWSLAWLPCIAQDTYLTQFQTSEGGAWTYSTALYNYFSANNPLGQTIPVQPAIGDLDGDGNLDLVLPVLPKVFGSTVEPTGSLLVVFGDGTGKFTRFQNLAVGTPVLSVALGDLNEDGSPDIAFYGLIKEKDGKYKHSIFLLFGDGIGKFTEQKVLEAPGGGLKVLAVDVNEDSRLDIVLVKMADQEGKFAIETRFGDGTGKFSSGVDAVSDTNFTALPTAIASTDFDKDGHMDIVAAGRKLAGKPTILFAYGDGKGGFTFDTIEREIGYLLYGVATGDFNGDGYPDVAEAIPWNMAEALNVYKKEGKRVTAPHLDLVSIFLNDGHRGWTIEDAYMGVQAMSIRSADVNQDAIADIVTFGVRGNASVVLGSKVTSESQPAVYTCAIPTVATIVMSFLGDFNNDGNVDFGVEHSLSGLVVRFGDGQGGFGPGWFSPPLDTPIPFGNTICSTLADFDEDGHLDVVYYGSHTGVGVAFGDGSGHFEDTTALIKLPDSYEVSGVHVGDFDGDGHTDVFVTAGEVTESKVWLFLGTGHRLFHGQQPILTMSDNIGSVVVGDFNEDGVLDVIIAPVLEPPFVSLGTVDGRIYELHRGNELRIPTTQGSFSLDYENLWLGDFNNDGHIDLLATVEWIKDHKPYAAVVLWLGDGYGGFKATNLLPYDVSIDGVKDYNKDGVLDFVGITLGDDKPPLLFLGDGSGHFTVQETDDHVSVGDVVTDLNSDGYMDSLAGLDRGMTVELGDKEGNIAQRGVFATQGHPQAGAVGSFIGGDFNDDGRLDVVSCNGSYISVLLNRLGGGK